MEISFGKNIHGSIISYDDLLSYLSQIVLSKTDEKIEKRHLTLKEIKIKLSESKKDLGIAKKRLIKVFLENKRLIALHQVLNMIRTLKEEGCLIGNNRVKIAKLLYTIQDQNIDVLRSLKKKLSVYLPDQYSRVAIS